MPAEVPLQDAAVCGPVEDGAPCLQLSDTSRRLFGVQFGHPPAVQVLAAAHGVCKVNSPTIAFVDIRESGRDTSLRHYGMSFAQQRLRDHSDFGATSGGFRGSPQARTARSITSTSYSCVKYSLTKEFSNLSRFPSSTCERTGQQTPPKTGSTRRMSYGGG